MRKWDILSISLKLSKKLAVMLWDRYCMFETKDTWLISCVLTEKDPHRVIVHLLVTCSMNHFNTLANSDHWLVEYHVDFN